MTTSTIGFIGMGIMGSAMAINTVKAGHEVLVYNRTPEKCQDAVNSGAEQAASLQEITERCDKIIIMLSDGSAVEQTITSLSTGLNASKIIVNMSTLSRKETQAVAKQIRDTGAVFVDAPVSGSKKPAEDGALVVLAGGDFTTITEVQSVFDAVGKKTVYCGDIGQGTMMKLSINLLLGICMEGLTETVAYGEQGGLDAATIMEVVNAGALACPLFSVKTEMMEQKTYPPQFPLKHMAKDFRCITQAADELGAHLLLGRNAAKEFGRLEEEYGEEDVAAIYRSYA